MTLDRESELNLARDAPAAATFLAGRGGRLHEPKQSDPDTWWAQMHPAAEPTETYFVRISWREYPSAPPIAEGRRIAAPMRVMLCAARPRRE
jgi:hypothetical protein